MNRKIDLNKNRLPKAKKSYIVKFIIYVIVLIGLGVYVHYALNKKEKPVNIELNELELETTEY